MDAKQCTVYLPHSRWPPKVSSDHSPSVSRQDVLHEPAQAPVLCDAVPDTRMPHAQILSDDELKIAGEKALFLGGLRSLKEE